MHLTIAVVLEALGLSGAQKVKNAIEHGFDNDTFLQFIVNHLVKNQLSGKKPKIRILGTLLVIDNLVFNCIAGRGSEFFFVISSKKKIRFYTGTYNEKFGTLFSKSMACDSIQNLGVVYDKFFWEHLSIFTEEQTKELEAMVAGWAM